MHNYRGCVMKRTEHHRSAWKLEAQNRIGHAIHSRAFNAFPLTHSRSQSGESTQSEHTNFSQTASTRTTTMTEQQQQEPLPQDDPQLVITYRGNKVVMPLQEGTTVEQVKNVVAEQADPSLNLQPSDLKLLMKGKVLKEDSEDLFELLMPSSQGKSKPKKPFRLVATGVSSQQVQAVNEELAENMLNAPRVRDDLSRDGLKESEQRKRLGRYMMQKSGARGGINDEKYGFGKIEILPNLPNQTQARDILTTLANDPGILACMAQHKWKVGSLAELYPEGKVGESAVCVMGLNKNKGQQILLRIRTDDLCGFRKILTIRKVLYHELAHNVHSAHDGDFFQLNRQVEKECTALDWTNGAGLSTNAGNAGSAAPGTLYTAGAYRLGGGDVDGAGENRASINNATDRASMRELAARAALMRLTAEEEEMQQNCGCGRSDLFLPRPPGSPSQSSSASSNPSRHDPDKKDEDGMDIS
jgi:hypothetical protein